MFEVTEAPLVLERLSRAVSDRGAGAIVTFVGTTRDRNAGRRVVRLEYEAFASMAAKEMRALAAEAKRKWPLRKIAMAHRTGRVAIGQASVAIAVSAAHRKEAFEACHWLIDRLKEIVPIWKKEHFAGGAVWIGAQQGGHGRDLPRRRVAARRRTR
jgi:molybdopterin synthase catalytic subunit